MNSAVRLLLFAALVVLLPGCDSDAGSRGQGESDAAAVTPEIVNRGREIFFGEGGCYICHGTDGRGARGVGANLRDDEWWHSDGSLPALIRQIDEGVPGEQARNRFDAAMPPRGGSGISDADVQAVAAYVWSFRSLPDTVDELQERSPR